jgi:hypothetical protein
LRVLFAVKQATVFVAALHSASLSNQDFLLLQEEGMEDTETMMMNI